MSTPQVIPEFVSSTIHGAEACRCYRGHAAGITTFNGVPVILLAASKSTLVDAIKEISPNTRIDPTLFRQAAIIDVQHLKPIDVSDL